MLPCRWPSCLLAWTRNLYGSAPLPVCICPILDARYKRGDPLLFVGCWFLYLVPLDAAPSWLSRRAALAVASATLDLRVKRLAHVTLPGPSSECLRDEYFLSWILNVFFFMTWTIQFQIIARKRSLICWLSSGIIQGNKFLPLRNLRLFVIFSFPICIFF